MIVRDIKRVVLIVGPLAFLVLLALGHWDNFRKDLVRFSGWGQGLSIQPVAGDGTPAAIPNADVSVAPGVAPSNYREIFARSTLDRKPFTLLFGSENTFNPNILPHPTIPDTYMVVAQRNRSSTFLSWYDQRYCVEISCNAVFKDGSLTCLHEPVVLPIAATFGDKCEGDLAILNNNIGPHDARVFMGPTAPYITYGSNSGYTCFGQWVQDFRVLTEWGGESYQKAVFRSGTEIQRPAPFSPLEKNFFLFWDTDNKTYAHYDIAPRRVFAQLHADGSIGEDLAPKAAFSDEACLAKRIPAVGPKDESIHQSTNSLSVAFCNRGDPGCIANETNTYIFHIFQHKRYHNFHSSYDSYVMLFPRRAPFELSAVSSRPLWIHGRQNDAEMYYIVSMSWKSPNTTYHGYLDDELFLSFGIEDQKSAGLDILAADLLAEMALCSDD